MHIQDASPDAAKGRKILKIAGIGCFLIILLIIVALCLILKSRWEYHERKWNSESHLIHGVLKLRPSMNKGEVENIIPKKFKRWERINPSNKFTSTRRFSNSSMYSEIKYAEYPDSGACQVYVRFDKNDVIVGLSYYASGYPQLKKDDLVFPDTEVPRPHPQR
jgi:hypothetical protein